MNFNEIANEIDVKVESIKNEAVSSCDPALAMNAGWDMGQLSMASSIVRHIGGKRPSESVEDVSKKDESESRISVEPASNITVVITNFRRPDKVLIAFESCVDAGVKNVVLSASGSDFALKAVHEEFKRRMPSIVINSIDEDRGCNEMWLRGVKLAKTKWVHILHDDDKLLPNFMELESHLNSGAEFYHWDGAKHAWPDHLVANVPPTYQTFPGLRDGIHSTDAFWPFLLNPNASSLSPVSGLFPREHVIEVLEECEKEFVGEEFHYTPTLMVGNDIMLWLRAVEKYAKFQYFRTPFISYGHWLGSCSYADSRVGSVRLKKIYNATRDYYLKGPEIRQEDLVMVRPISVFKPKDRDKSRYDMSSKLWTDQYATNKWVHIEVEDSQLPRVFSDDRGRSLPYVKDLIDHAFSSKHDVCVLANSDSLPSPSLTRHLEFALRTNDAAYSYRRDVEKFESLDDVQIRTKTLTYAGVDLIAITRRWWAENKSKYPDMLFATEAWDYVMRTLMDETGARRFMYLIYHIKHSPESTYNAGSTSQKYNRSVSEWWLRNRGIEPYWLSAKPVNVNPR